MDKEIKPGVFEVENPVLGKLSQNGIVSFFNFLIPHVYETGGITL